MKTKKVIVLPYDAQWKQDFEDIRRELAEALGDTALSIEHVGSTSVEGLSAKPIIDIDVVIENDEMFAEACGRLESVGYRHEGNLGIEGREAFGYDGKEHLRKHHLYVCARDSEELRRHIAFREYLKADKDAAEEYGRIKTEGARLYPEDIEGYIRHKSAFIEAVYKRCGVCRPDVRMMEENEIEEAAAFSWRLCAEKRFRSYPLMQSEDELKERYIKSMRDPDGGVMVCMSGGVMRGAVCWYSLKEDLYLQTTGLYAENAEAIEALIEAVEGKYSGYEAYIGVTRENIEAARVLKGRGYRLVDDCLDMRLDVEKRIEHERDCNVMRADGEWKEQYLEYHERCFNEGYWNRERIEADFTNWDIYVAIEDGKISAALFAKDYGNGTGEIFGVEAAEEKAALRLFANAVSDLCKIHDGVKEIVFMAEAADRMLIDSALHTGFEEKSSYCCWMKKLADESEGKEYA